MHCSVVRILTAGAVAALTLTGVQAREREDQDTRHPIRHLVVIFQENVSFDHYFATYPHALNPAGEPAFHASSDTPTVNGLGIGLRTKNPNAANPFRFSRAQAATCDQGHDYTQEQLAFDHGLMDKFVEFTGNGGPGCDKRQVMGYFDGNTVTALWNYAQHFAMRDNSFNTTFGPSTPGALNLISGQTNGAFPAVPGETIAGSVIGDPQPTYDDCTSRDHVAMSGRNVGDLLNDHGDSSRAVSRRRAGARAARRSAVRRTSGAMASRRGTTFRTISHSSTTSPPRIPTTCRRLPSRRSGTPIRPITSTTCRTSGAPRKPIICPPSVS